MRAEVTEKDGGGLEARREVSRAENDPSVLKTAEVGHRMQESERDVLVFDWDQKLSTCCCSCLSYLMQLILMAACGSFLFGFNIALLNTSVAHIMWEFGWCDLSDEITGCQAATNYSAFLNTSVFIGAAIGSLTGGSFMGFGRRIMILISMAIFAFGIIASCCANSFSALLFARLVCGYAVGLVSVCVPTYMAEITPPSVRGKYASYHQLFVTGGIVIGTVVGLPLALVDPVPEGMPPSGQLHPEIGTFSMIWWRVMLGVAIFPVILVTYLLLKVYTFETPHYYIEKDHYADAEMLLRKLLNKADVSTELREMTDEVESAKRAALSGMSLREALSRKEYRFVIFYGCLFAAFQQLVGINVFIASSNDLFLEAGLTGHMPTVLTIAVTFLNCIMALPAMFVMDKVGRRPLMIVGTVMMTLCVLPGAICYWALEEGSKVTMWLALVGCFGYILFFASTYGPVNWVYLFEIFPVEIKDAASGLAIACNWTGSIIMVFLGSYLNNKILFTVFTGMCGVGALQVILWMRETKGRVLGDSPYVNKD